MNEPARRLSPSLGTEAVRRLMARPIQDRLALAHRQRAPLTGEPTTAEEPALRPAEPSPITAEAPVHDGEAAAEAPEVGPEETRASDLARLKVEVLLMKAALQAERRESESLRACLGLDAPDGSLGEEARAVRLRWAALVDRLIHAPRQD